MDTLASLILKIDGIDIEVTVTYVSEFNLRIVAKDLYNFRRWTGNIGKGFFDQFASKLTPQIAWKIAYTGFQTQKKDYRFDLIRPENMKLDEQNLTKYKNYIILLLKYDGMLSCNMPFPLMSTPFTPEELIGFIKTMKAEKTALETQKRDYFLMQKQIEEMNEEFTKQKQVMEDQIEELQDEIEELHKTIDQKDETIRKLKETRGDTYFSSKRRQPSPARNTQQATKSARNTSPFRSMSLIERQALLDSKHPPRNVHSKAPVITTKRKLSSQYQQTRSGSNSRNSSVVNSRRNSSQSSAAASVSSSRRSSAANSRKSSATNSRRSSATNSRRSSAYGSRAPSPSASRHSSGISSARNSRSSTPTNSRPSSRNGKSPAFHRFNPTEWVRANQKKRAPSPHTFYN